MTYAGKIVVATATLAMLTGCKVDLSEITDEQLLRLLGDNTTPAQITTKTRECAQLMSGRAPDGADNMPQELRDQLIAECEATLTRRLSDESRNDTELTIEDFEREALAERIIELEAAQESALAARKRASDEEKREALRAELAEAIDRGDTLKVELQERRQALAPQCAKLKDMRSELKARDQTNSLFLKGLPFICGGSSSGPLDDKWEQLERFEQEAASFELPDRAGLGFVRIPEPPRVDLEEIDAQAGDVSEAVEAYQKALDALE
ncbi:hypothetical protein [Roseivivax sediminis]|uniref:Uncharacterized protein n=1 Tax=Roseivivax sediminis TaxID=936889 RepID=A0A1I2E0R0_9RHOB|nr:hypothetical protein [Roseivivax sediminis]SFE86445.1 hypothetical protein SAMN04515678_1201 [Roseivivax sediminis]